MQRRLFLLIFLSVILVQNAKAVLPPFNYAENGTGPIALTLDSLLTDPLLDVSQVGLMVYDLTADSALYCHGHRQTLRPASTMKLVTAITALDCLGSNYRFTTMLSTAGRIVGRTLHGDVYCIGGMDPLLSNDDLQSFVESLREQGIDSVAGHLVTDLTMKDTLRYGEGWCWDDDNPLLSPLSVERHTDVAQRLLSRLLADDIVFTNNDNVVTTYNDVVRIGAAPDSAEMVAVRWHTISQVLMPMMKRSDNFYAEALYYQVAASASTRSARAADARLRERELLSRLGVATGTYRLADGSGLSLYNYLSADILVRLLRYAWLNPEIQATLLPSLPVAAIDGTLKSRMAGTAAAGNVRAKTGTLTGVSSLAGYCIAANGHQLCFAIINQGALRAAAARALQDSICDALCR